MTTLIVSDLHIGSPFFRRAQFLRLLDALPADTALMLNGDIVDHPSRHLPPAGQAVLARLAAESRRRSVTWIYGNHDDGYVPSDPGRIAFVRHATIERRLLVAHGHWFEDITPRHHWFIVLFRHLHAWRIRLGASPVHVAEYAKKWALLYGFLRRNAMRHAVARARAGGYSAVACGHVHGAEDGVFEGVRYINGGAWTETPSHAIWVSPETIELLDAEQLVARLGGRREGKLRPQTTQERYTT